MKTMMRDWMDTASKLIFVSNKHIMRGGEITRCSQSFRFVDARRGDAHVHKWGYVDSEINGEAEAVESALEDATPSGTVPLLASCEAGNTLRQREREPAPDRTITIYRRDAVPRRNNGQLGVASLALGDGAHNLSLGLDEVFPQVPVNNYLEFGTVPSDVLDQPRPVRFTVPTCHHEDSRRRRPYLPYSTPDALPGSGR